MLRTVRFVLPAVSVFLSAMCVGTARAADLTSIASPLPVSGVCLPMESANGAANQCSDDAIQAGFD